MLVKNIYLNVIFELEIYIIEMNKNELCYFRCEPVKLYLFLKIISQ